VLQLHVTAPVPTLPPALSRYQWLLDRLMAQSRDDRFASAQAALDAIAAQPLPGAAQTAVVAL